MVRHNRITRWTARLHSAVATQDWAALEATDRELAEMLPILAAHGRWTPEERSALHSLELAHREARRSCQLASDALQSHMSGLREHKDGWLAYALHSSPDEVRT